MLRFKKRYFKNYVSTSFLDAVETQVQLDIAVRDNFIRHIVQLGCRL